MNEEAEAETDKWNKRASGGKKPEGYLKEKAFDDEVRSVFRNAIRIDAGPEDVNRVMRAIKALKDSGDGEDL
jgi:hypothetical protein